MIFDGPLSETWPPERIIAASSVRLGTARDRRAGLRPRSAAAVHGARLAASAQEDEVERYVEFFAEQAETFPIFEHRLRETFAMVLISPEFLYLMEPDSKNKRPLDGWELASRLSYALWSTMPDERLLTIAAEGGLQQPATLQAEVARMLDDERAWRFVDEFVGQWLYLEGMDRVAVSQDYYPQFRPSLSQAIRDETRHFIMELLRNDLSAANLVDSDFLVLNETMARHYGIEGVWGSKFRRVPVPAESGRGGLLTQASVLLANSTGEDSHPIKRAVWVRKRLLDDPPPPPPANVPELDAESPELAGLSVREQLRLHRSDQSCASCHEDIDPWGVAFEHFDAIGQWRDRRSARSSRGPSRPRAATARTTTEKPKPAPPEFDLLPVDAQRNVCRTGPRFTASTTCERTCSARGARTLPARSSPS